MPVRLEAKVFLQMKGVFLNIINTKFHLSCSRRSCIFFTLLLIIICISILPTVPHIGFDDPTSWSTDDFHLPKRLQCSYKNKTRLEHGRLHLAQSNVIICGLIHDRELHISRLKQQIEEITPLFADYAIVIVENNSKDRTRHELIRWAQEKKFVGRIHVIGCGNIVNDATPCNMTSISTLSSMDPATRRIEKLARLRNIYMQYIEENFQLAKFDYVIIQDFDLRTFIYTDGLLSTGYHFSVDPTIDAICAYGIHHHRMLGRRRYYDPYAHKDDQNKNWMRWFDDRWSTLFRVYPCSTHLVPVQSCFNGRTMYRYASIKGKRYYTYPDLFNQPTCEHVGFHETLSNVYLNSEMIFYIIKNHFW